MIVHFKWIIVIFLQNNFAKQLYFPFCHLQDKCRRCVYVRVGRVCVCVCIPAELRRFRVHSAGASWWQWHHRAVGRAGPLPASVRAGWERQWTRVEITSSLCQKQLKQQTCPLEWLFSLTGRGFNNLSLVNMVRHVPSGQLVAVKRTNLDECTEEELLQLMVRHFPEKEFLVLQNWPILMFGHVLKPRMRFCCPGCSVTPTCWPHAWFSAPAASCGFWLRWWLTVSCRNPLLSTHWGFPSTACCFIPLSEWKKQVSFPSPLACRLGRHFTKNIFSGRNEWIPDSLPAARRAESIGVPAPDGLRSQVSACKH